MPESSRPSLGLRKADLLGHLEYRKANTIIAGKGGRGTTKPISAVSWIHGCESPLPPCSLWRWRELCSCSLQKNLWSVYLGFCSLRTNVSMKDSNFQFFSKTRRDIFIGIKTWAGVCKKPLAGLSEIPNARGVQFLSPQEKVAPFRCYHEGFWNRTPINTRACVY